MGNLKFNKVNMFKEKRFIYQEKPDNFESQESEKIVFETAEANDSEAIREKMDKRENQMIRILNECVSMTEDIVGAVYIDNVDSDYEEGVASFSDFNDMVENIQFKANGGQAVMDVKNEAMRLINSGPSLEEMDDMVADLKTFRNRLKQYAADSALAYEETLAEEDAEPVSEFSEKAQKLINNIQELAVDIDPDVVYEELKVKGGRYPSTAVPLESVREGHGLRFSSRELKNEFLEEGGDELVKKLEKQMEKDNS